MLWPILLLAIKPIWNYIAGLFNLTPIAEKSAKTAVCTGDSCCIPNTKEEDTKAPIEEKANDAKSDEKGTNYITFSESDSLDEVCGKSSQYFR